MSRAETAVIAAAIAAVATFVGTVITAVVAIRNERQRAQAAVDVEVRRGEASAQEAFVQELRSRTADVFGQLLAMQHSMEWLTWHAQHDPASISRLHEQYEQEVHRTYPQLLGAMSVTAALDLTLYLELRLLVNKVYELEGKVAISLITAARPGPEQNDALRDLAALNPAVIDLFEELPIKLAEAMRKAQVAGTRDD
jgi:LPS O-antigen subunit length determinant protein (WzzB/FepE family)